MDARDPLQVIHGVRPRTAADLRLLGIRSVDDLCDGDLQKLYDRLVGAEGHPAARCVVCVFRCTMYYASCGTHDGELPRCWNRKDGDVAARFVKTLKEQIICERVCRMVAELHAAVDAFVDLYNEQWLPGKNGFLSAAATREAWYARRVAA